VYNQFVESDEGCWSDHPRPGPGLGPQAPHQGPAGLPGGNTHSATPMGKAFTGTVWMFLSLSLVPRAR